MTLGREVDQALRGKKPPAERTPVADALEAARAIEAQVASNGLDSQSMGALVAAARIRGWHDSLGAIFALAEADIMECCLAIRRQYPDRDAFGGFVTEHVRVLTPARAWQLADTWEVARRHRPVRELVAREPKKAIAFVREFTAAAAEEQVPLPLDADDREIADILASPPRRRREHLRELVAARRAPRDRHPDDVARIEELEAEQQAAGEAATPDLHGLKVAVDELARLEAALAEACSCVVEMLGEERPAEGLTDRLRRICDRGVGDFDDVTARLADWAFDEAHK